MHTSGTYGQDLISSRPRGWLRTAAVIIILWREKVASLSSKTLSWIPLAGPAVMLMIAGCFLTEPEPSSKVGSEVFEGLRDNGEVRVVVFLTLPAEFAGPDADPAERREGIAQVQDDVLAALTASDYSAVQRFDSVPAVVLTIISEAGLAKLESHPDVEKVDLDTGGGGLPG